MTDGAILVGESGQRYQVLAAAENLSFVSCDDNFLLMRVAYHLGNRHVPLDIQSDSLRFQPDHVLEDMVVQLGAKVSRAKVPFQPEEGAYHSHDHAHEAASEQG